MFNLLKEHSAIFKRLDRLILAGAGVLALLYIISGVFVFRPMKRR